MNESPKAIEFAVVNHAARRAKPPCPSCSLCPFFIAPLAQGFGNTKSTKEETQKAQKPKIFLFALFVLVLCFLCSHAAHPFNLSPPAFSPEPRSRSCFWRIAPDRIRRVCGAAPGDRSAHCSARSLSSRRDGSLRGRPRVAFGGRNRRSDSRTFRPFFRSRFESGRAIGRSPRADARRRGRSESGASMYVTRSRIRRRPSPEPDAS